MKNVIVIGDIHGTYKTFMALLEKIKEKYPDDQIVSVGDLIDRGPDSKGVVQYIIDHPEILVTKANHEEMCVVDMLCADPANQPYHGEWLVYQAGATLSSYQKDKVFQKELLVEHAKWMKELPYYLEFPDVKNEEGRYLVVSHASIGSNWKHRDPSSEFYSNFKTEVLWNRGMPKDVKSIYNIFGHTPSHEGVIVKSFYTNVDTGACLKRDYSELYGKLSALRFPSMEIIEQKNIDW